MNALKGTLTFILGMICGVVLFIAAIAGALYAAATMVSVNQLEETVGVTVTDEDSDIGEKSLYDIAMSLYGDIQSGITNMTLNELAKKYGVTTKLDGLNGYVEAIDFSPIFDVPIKDIGNSLNLIVENITLSDIGELAGIDFGTYDLPILKDNLNVGVTKALDAILKSIDGENMSLRMIEDNFGITLGENELFDMLKDAPLSSFGELVDAIEVGKLLGTDSDTFAINGSNPVFVKAGRYVEVASSEYSSAADGAKKYVSGASSGTLIYKELRYKVKTTVNADGETVEATDDGGNKIYVVDNASNTADFAADTENPVTYYRYVEYEAYSTSATYAADTEYFVPAYLNCYVSSTSGYVLKQDGYVSLKDVYTDSTLATSLNSSVSAAAITVPTTAYYKLEDESGAAVEAYGKNPEEYPSSSTRMELGGANTHLKVHAGTADQAIQAIAGISVSGLNNATDSLMNVKLSELIDINDSSSALLKSMKDKTLNELSSSIDDLLLGDVVTIDNSLFIEDTDGVYVFVESSSKYSLYTAAAGTVTRYSLSYSVSAEGKYVKAGGKYYLYDADDTALNAARDDTDRYDKVYTEASDGDYYKSEINGYYTLYNPADYATATRYSKITDALDAATPDYLKATDTQITAGTGLYYWDSDAKAMTAYTSGDHGTLYVKGSASSKVLQRLASVSIGKFSDEFSSLILGEVIDVDVDTYAATSDFSDVTLDYYYFLDGLYRLADEAYRTANPTETYYKIVAEGKGNSILKKLAFVKVDELSAKMDTIVDEMRLGEVVDVYTDFYYEDANGIYTYVPSGKYYTLYNAAGHSGATRYSKYTTVVGSDTFSYLKATDAQITAGTGLYYWDSVAGEMTPYTSGDLGTLYVQGKASSMTLQRFSSVLIGSFSDEFSKLILADTIAIDGDVYAVADAAYIAANPDVTYYYYDNGLYQVADAAYRGANPAETYYYVVKSGSSHVVLKKMAFLLVDDLGTRMTDVINGMYLSDLISINEYAEIRAFVDGTDADADARWLIDFNKVYTKTDGLGNVYYYTFVYDDGGKYYKSSYMYVDADATMLAVDNAAVTYGYTALPTTPALYAEYLPASLTSNSGNIYYRSGDGSLADPYVYTKNPALTTYLISKSDFSKLFYRDTTATGETYTTYYDDSHLYIKVLGKYVAYNSSNPSHADQQMYFKLSDGWYLADTSLTDAALGLTAGTDYAVGTHYYDYATDSFVTTASATTTSATFFSDGAAGYADYMIALDDGFTSGTDITYSKQECRWNYKQATDGAYVKVDGKYVAYDSAIHDGLQRFNVYRGYLATENETMLAGGLNPISSDKVIIVTAVSSPVLKAFAENHVTVGNLDDAMKDFTIDDLMDVEPDSMFDSPAIRNAKIDDLSTVLRDQLNGMTIGELLEWSNIHTMSSTTKAILQDVTLEDFFGSLSYNATSGSIEVDMAKLYGLS